MHQPAALVRIVVLLLTVVLLAACGTSGSTTTGPTPEAEAAPGTANTLPIRAVATTSIIADLVSNVGGERVNIQSLLPPGADPHTYSPTPGDVQAISSADILFKNGLGLEEWIEDVIENAGGSHATVIVSDGLEAIESDHHDDHSDERTDNEQIDDHAHDDGDKDPHMWFDVQKTIGYVENVRDGLKEIDPDGANIYHQNAANYVQQLSQLDAEIVEQVETIPAERRKLITNHHTFGYFAERYGFEIVGTVFEGVSTEQEPSAQQIAQLVELIRAENVPAIFAENIANPRLAEQVADEAGAKIVTDLYTDALGEPGSPGATYIDMMRYNVREIVDALQ